MAAAAIALGDKASAMVGDSTVGDEDPTTLKTMAVVTIGLETRAGMDFISKLRDDPGAYGGRWMLVDTRVFVSALPAAANSWQDGRDPYIQRLVLEKSSVVEMCSAIFECIRNDGIRNLVIACRGGRLTSDVISRLVTEFVNHAAVDDKRYYNCMRWSLAAVADAREFYSIIENVRRWAGPMDFL